MKQMKEKVFLCGKGRGLWKELARFLGPSPAQQLVGWFSPFLSLGFLHMEAGAL